ncbi:type II secretion system protein F, partial [Nocardioides sp. zg-ZUI104]|nr:type II secretion system protein F [Nocardioides faecalis]
MGALVGLGFGLGCLLIWSAFRWPRRARTTPASVGRTRALLAEAGMREVSPSSLHALCLCAGLLGAIVVLGLTRTPSIALVLGVLAGVLPRAVVAGRAPRRPRGRPEVWPAAVG